MAGLDKKIGMYLIHMIMKPKFILSVLMALIFASIGAISQPPNGEEFTDPKIDHFWIAIGTSIEPGLSGGGPVNEPGEDGLWYSYVAPSGEQWFNIWFFDDPLDMSKMKKIRMGFYVMTINPEIPGMLFYVVNWSTPAWDPDIPGFPPPGAEVFIQRSPTNGPIPVPPMIPQPGQWFELYFEIPDYNPEWISVDIFGNNIQVLQQPVPPPPESPLSAWYDGGPGGIIVHECLFKGDYDFGDAPENDTAYINPVVIGNFPTCIMVGTANSFIAHGCPSALFFGAFVDCENDGNAGFCPTFGPNWYNMDECGTFPYPIPPTAPPLGPVDEGLMNPNPLTLGLQQPGFYGYFPCGAQNAQPLGLSCQTAYWGQSIDIWLNGINPNTASPGYFNLLFDWNMDGDWLDTVYCQSVMVTEHVIVDFPIPAGFIGPISTLNPPNFTIGPNGGYAWARFSLTESQVGPGWDGAGSFYDGETEDYLIKVTPRVIPISNWAIFIAAVMIVIFVGFIWWRNR